jgi:hypothetical protein
MSIGALNWAFSQSVMGPAKAVLIVLADHVDQDGWCWPTVARLGFRAGCDVRSVQRGLRQLAAAGLVLIQSGTGRGHSSRYRLLHNLDEHQEAVPRHTNGAAKDDTQSPITKGDTQSPIIQEPLKGDSESLKGDAQSRKGDTQSPEPLRTTTKRTTRGTRARTRTSAAPRNVYDQILEELGGRSLLLPPLPDEHNPSVRPRLQ